MSNRENTILVTGATGMTGLEVCWQLAAIPGLEVRAALYSPRKRSLLPPGVAAVPFDLDNAVVVDRALRGIQSLFLLTPGGPSSLSAIRAVIDAAGRHGVRRVVRLSSIDPDREPRAPHERWAYETEALVRESEIPSTFVRPAWLYQNFTRGHCMSQLMCGRLKLSGDRSRAGWVDARDAAAVAVKALVEDGHLGKTYRPTGPDALAIEEIAAVLSKTTGQPIRCEQPRDEEWARDAMATGYSDAQARFVRHLAAGARNGRDDRLTGDVERVTGREPRSFGEFARDHAGLLTLLADAA